jgi:chitin synthase
MLESTYNALNLLFSWFALANFYIFYVSTTIVRADSQVILTSALESSIFNIPHIDILNRILQVSPL